MSDMDKVLNFGKKDPSEFFKEIYKFKLTGVTKFGESKKVLTALSNTDDYRKVGLTVRQSNYEMKRIRKIFRKKNMASFRKEVISFLKKKITSIEAKDENREDPEEITSVAS